MCKETKYFEHWSLSKYEGIFFPCKKKKRTNKVSIYNCICGVNTPDISGDFWWKRANI